MKMFQSYIRKTLLKSNVSSAKFISTGKDSAANDKTDQKTVDLEDVKLHSQYAKDWWDSNKLHKPLHSFNLIRIPFIRDGLLSGVREKTRLPLLDKSILDVGCGGGILSEGLARIGAKVTGLDASKDLIQIAKEHSKLDPKIADNKPTYICSTIEEHSKSNPNYYDGVVASEVIEHVNNKELFVKSCVETVKPGGKLFFTTPNRTRASQVLVIHVAEDLLRIVPKGNHAYDKFITPNELTFMLERNNCHVEAVYGIIYNPFTDRWSWSNTQMLLFALEAVKCEDQKE